MSRFQQGCVFAQAAARVRVSVVINQLLSAVWFCQEQVAHTNLKCYKVRPLKPTAVQATATVTVQL